MVWSCFKEEVLKYGNRNVKAAKIKMSASTEGKAKTVGASGQTLRSTAWMRCSGGLPGGFAEYDTLVISVERATGSRLGLSATPLMTRAHVA